MNSPIKCILFDSDGTLVDSEYLGHLTLERQFRKRGIEESATELMAAFQGAQLAKIIDSIAHKHAVILDDAFVAQYRQALEQTFADELRPVDGIADVLSKIQQAICVASGGPLRKIQLALSLTELDSYFKGKLFSSYEIGSWKPEPDLFLHAAQQMGFAPGECAVVEDSPVGIYAAQAAKMKAILYDPMNKHPHPEGVIIIREMSELESIFSVRS